MQGGFHPSPEKVAADIAGHDEVPMLLLRTAKAMVERMTKPQVDGQPHLTAVHGLAARFIDDRGGATTVDVAHHLNITKQSASEVVKALEDVGAVERHPHPDDRRARIVRLTPDGEAKLAQSRARWAALEQEWADLCGADAIAQLRECLLAYLASAPAGTEPPSVAASTTA